MINLKKNYILLCYYAKPYYKSLDIELNDSYYDRCACPSSIDMTIDINEFDIITNVYPMLRSIKSESIDKLGYITDPIQLIYYTQLLKNIEYKFIKAKVILKSDLFDIDKFNSN